MEARVRNKLRPLAFAAGSILPILIAGGSVLPAVGCSTIELTPQGESVRKTTNPEDARGCTPLGKLEWEAQVGTVPDPWKALQNDTAILGGLRTQGPAVFGNKWVGVAYRCDQPTP
jgi:hypothetical protein